MLTEQQLWQAVVLKAAIDATGDTEDEKIKADDWFRKGGKDFQTVCLLAGLNPDFIQAAYVEGRIDAKLLRAAR